MTFGEKFRKKREEMGLTQQKMAEQLGLNRRMITRYENGQSFPRSREAYRRIADFLGVNVNYLLTEEQDFVVKAAQQFGSRGMRQAQALIEDMSGLFAGGSLSQNDKDAVMRALQDIYWESKERNAQKYTPKKYKPKKDSRE